MKAWQSKSIRSASDIISEGVPHFRSNLIKRLMDLRKKKTFCDLTIATQHGDVHCHKVILSAGCPEFSRQFGRDPAIRNVEAFKDTGISVVESVVDFMYSGHLCVQWESVKEVLWAPAVVQLQLDLKPAKEVYNHKPWIREKVLSS